MRQFAPEPAGLPSTTHISVVDAHGNAASLSASTGCGSGVIVPGTGIHMNNMLGEEDLNPGGREGSPGNRLTSMMAPSIVLEEGRPRLVVGSAGSIRLRAAILQFVVNVLDHGLTVREAIEAPRVHLEGEALQVEGGIEPDTADQLESAGYEVVRWSGRTSTSAAPPQSGSARRGSSRRPAIRDEEERGRSSSDGGRPQRGAGRRRRARAPGARPSGRRRAAG